MQRMGEAATANQLAPLARSRSACPTSLRARTRHHSVYGKQLLFHPFSLGRGRQSSATVLSAPNRRLLLAIRPYQQIQFPEPEAARARCPCWGDAHREETTSAPRAQTLNQPIAIWGVAPSGWVPLNRPPLYLERKSCPTEIRKPRNRSSGQPISTKEARSSKRQASTRRRPIPAPRQAPTTRPSPRRPVIGSGRTSSSSNWGKAAWGPSSSQNRRSPSGE